MCDDHKPRGVSDMTADMICYTRFVPSIAYGGGARRALQLQTIFQAINPDMVIFSAPRCDGIPLPEVFRQAAKKKKSSMGTLLQYIHLFRWSEAHQPMVRRHRALSRIWSRQAHVLNRLRLVVMDDPIYFEPLLNTLLKRRIPVVALCQNLESLANGQVRDRYRLEQLCREVHLLGRCDLVVTISREEDVLLRNMGVNTCYLPYYPVPEIEARLLKIRERRSASEKKGWLVMGNMKNSPTRIGVEAFAAFWQRQGLAERFGRLLVAGFNSEQFFDHRRFESAVEFLGTLDTERHDELLGRIQAMLVFQNQGAGALTRIQEMLIAGVPVLANDHAARSYYGTPGVITFSDLDLLPERLEQLMANPPNLPLPPPPDISALLRRVEQICRPQ